MPTNDNAVNVQLYKLKVTLSDTDPPIWRRLQVPGNISLAVLHRLLQLAMGWEDYHLHQFSVGGTGYGPSGKGLGLKNEKNFTLGQVVSSEGTSFIYQYDFGDSWDHIVLVEKIAAPEDGQSYPVCLAGKGACPPEDVGGIWGFYSFLEAIQDPNHPDHDDMVQWVERDYDPDEFSVDAVNKLLRKVR